MNLDDPALIKNLDKNNYYPEILNFPTHLSEGWRIGQTNPIQFRGTSIENILICGMGGSAIGADLAAAFARNQSKVPIVICRDYDLPAWVAGEHTLVIASSHSGNTEETLSCFKEAKLNGCRILAISTGGQLEKIAVDARSTFWKFSHSGQPRAAVGFSLGFMLSAFTQLDLIEDPTESIENTVGLIQNESANFVLETQIHKNPAKRLAGQMVGRIPIIFGSDYLAPVARRFKTQVNELAKSWAQFELLPEADHNTAAGIEYPETACRQIFALFLESPTDHPRNRLRSQMTKQKFLIEGINCDSYLVPGETPLENICAGVQFCDFVSFYLAIALNVDPTPIPGIAAIKNSMAGK
jgi:glucose/mannose-6-phosphate isomerase